MAKNSAPSQPETFSDDDIKRLTQAYNEARGGESSEEIAASIATRFGWSEEAVKKAIRNRKLAYAKKKAQGKKRRNSTTPMTSDTNSLQGGPHVWRINIDAGCCIQQWDLGYPIGEFPFALLNQTISYQGHSYDILRIYTGEIFVTTLRNPAHYQQEEGH